ncbi:MAG: hypothetical protein GTO02_20440 [Candidatus Dadabacteria bacterium]|nr:hypothetical protein [Candidatus Dadabacteria bacterium]
MKQRRKRNKPHFVQTINIASGIWYYNSQDPETGAWVFVNENKQRFHLPQSKVDKYLTETKVLQPNKVTKIKNAGGRIHENRI